MDSVKKYDLDASIASNNFLQAVINGKPFEAFIVGGRYDGDEINWIRRSWGALYLQ